MTRKEKMDAIGKVLDRYSKNRELPFDRLSAFMDLDYSNVDVFKLLEADDVTFFHDTCGVFSYFNRETRRLDDLFMPRVGLLAA